MADQNWGAVLKQLSAPFDEGAIKVRIQGGKQVVPYIDARTVITRLNAVCAGDWTDEYHEGVIAGSIECRLTIAGVTRRDAVMINKGANGIDGAKATVSEALKRAAVKFGVGTICYSLPRMFLPQGKDASFLNSEAGRDYYRSQYRNWLNTPAGKVWGDVFSHGDDPTAVGDYEGDGESVAAPAPTPRPGSVAKPEVVKDETPVVFNVEEIERRVTEHKAQTNLGETARINATRGAHQEPLVEEAAAPAVYRAKDNCPSCDALGEIEKAGKLWPNRRTPSRLQCNGKANGKYLNHDFVNPDHQIDMSEPF